VGDTSEVLLPLLVLSIAGLLLGPALVALGRGRRGAGAAIDGLTLGVVPVLVLTRLLPHTMEGLGATAIGLALLGFLAVSFAHGGGHALEARIGRAVVVPTLFVHAVADGAGLALSAGAPQASTGFLLGAALILHRLPEGLFVATALAPPGVERGLRRTYVPVAMLAVGTLVGALGGQRLLGVLPEATVDGLVAFGIGAMLRLVMHTHTPAPDAAQRWVSAVTFLVGVGLVLVLPDPLGVLRRAQPMELSLVQSVGPLFVETAPAFLGGLAITGALHAFLPRRRAQWLGGGRRLSQAARGVAFGVPLPIGSCGVVPEAERLFGLDAPVAAVVAFAIAAPALAADGALMSLRLLGLPVTLARLAASVLLALAVALVVARQPRASRPSAASFAAFGPPADAVDARSEGAEVRLTEALREGFVDALDHLGAWYVVGILAAAVFEAAVDPKLAQAMPAPLVALASAAVAVPMWVSSLGATPLAAMMIHKGFSATAALALLLVGPATNLPILGLLRRELGLRATLTFVVTIATMGVACAFVLERALPTATVPALHPLVAHRHDALEWTATAALVALFGWSLLRMGPRGWIAAMVIESHDEHVRDHGCAHEHHDHDHP
jgi:uncharacterized membrane protein YraQ (UPF0718 family)